MSPVRRAPDELTNSESTLRVQYLHQVLDLLWPDPATRVVGRAELADRTRAEFLVVPGLSRPRLLVPLGSRRAAATALRRYSEPKTRLARWRLAALAGAMRTGLGPLVMRDRVRIGGPATAPGIETHLADVLGREVQVSLHIGPARANRKPVLQLLSGAGEVVGFVKVGVNDLTRRLVASETRSLEHVGAASFRVTEVPRVLHAGRWQDLEVLVQSPLPIWEDRAPLTEDRLVASMLEVGSVDGVTRLVLSDTPYWARLSAALDRLAPTETVDQLRAAFTVLTERARTAEVPIGAWHGDWTHWNMAVLRDRLLVWDWERFETGVPLGYDALHFDLQKAVVGKTADPRAGVSQCLGRAPVLLAPFGVDAADAEVVALSYLVDLAVRYLQDGQAEAGARLGVLGQWLLPELVERVSAG